MFSELYPNDLPCAFILHLQAEEIKGPVYATGCMYYALMLEPVDQSTYRRVGVALLYEHAYKPGNVELANFGIIQEIQSQCSRIA